MACSTARALASTMSVEAPCPESDLPATRTCTNTWPRLSPPGVTDWIARFTTSTRRSTTALIAAIAAAIGPLPRSEEHTSELQSQSNLVCRLLLEQKQRRGSAALRRDDP